MLNKLITLLYVGVGFTVICGLITTVSIIIGYEISKRVK